MFTFSYYVRIKSNPGTHSTAQNEMLPISKSWRQLSFAIIWSEQKKFDKVFIIQQQKQCYRMLRFSSQSTNKSIKSTLHWTMIFNPENWK